MSLTAESILSRTLTTTKWREGYAQPEVDAFLRRVADALRLRELGHGTTLTAEEVRAARFAATKFLAGYDQDEVDDLLDEVAALLPAAG